MDNTPRRRRSTGPARSPGGGVRAGRSAVWKRAADRVPSTAGSADIGTAAAGAAAGVGVDPASADRPVSGRVRSRRVTRPAATHPGSAPWPATGRRGTRVPAAVSPASQAARIPKSRLAFHLAVLGLVFCAVALVLAVPLRNYFSQREELAAARTRELQMTGQITDLQAKKAALSDPAYLASEAKRRLQYVKPGDTVFVVAAPDLPPAAAPRPAGSAKPSPWYSNLWDALAAPPATAASRAPFGNAGR